MGIEHLVSEIQIIETMTACRCPEDGPADYRCQLHGSL